MGPHTHTNPDFHVYGSKPLGWIGLGYAGATEGEGEGGALSRALKRVRAVLPGGANSLGAKRKASARLRAATTIQRVWRGAIARRRKAGLRVAVRDKAEMEDLLRWVEGLDAALASSWGEIQPPLFFALYLPISLVCLALYLSISGSVFLSFHLSLCLYVFNVLVVSRP